MQIAEQWMGIVLMNLFCNAMSKQASQSHSVFPPELENNYNVVALDDDMSLINHMDTNTIHNNLSLEHLLLQNRKRAAIEDDTGIDNSNIVEKVPLISMENGDQSQPQQPIKMRTNPYNSYISWHECMAYVDRPPMKLFPSHMQMFNWIANGLDPSDIPMFLTLENSIRTYSQGINNVVVAFNNEGPSFIHQEILKLFRTKMIGKTPAWTIAHYYQVQGNIIINFLVTFPSWAKQEKTHCLKCYH